jgi:hypothetical protein
MSSAVINKTLEISKNKARENPKFKIQGGFGSAGGEDK